MRHQNNTNLDWAILSERAGIVAVSVFADISFEFGNYSSEAGLSKQACRTCCLPKQTLHNYCQLWGFPLARESPNSKMRKVNKQYDQVTINDRPGDDGKAPKFVPPGVSCIMYHMQYFHNSSIKYAEFWLKIKPKMTQFVHFIQMFAILYLFWLDFEWGKLIRWYFGSCSKLWMPKYDKIGTFGDILVKFM